MKVEITYPVEGFTRYPYTVLRPYDAGTKTAKYAAGCRTTEEAEKIADRIGGTVVATTNIKGKWDYNRNYKRWYLD